MKKIKLFPAPHVEVRVHVSERMVDDLKECKQLSELPEGGKDCDQCSWREVELETTCLCDWPIITEKVLEEES